MYYKLRSTILFRKYESFGYLTDNRNFGYHFLDKNFVIGDKIVSESGAVILSFVNKTPQKLEDIALKVHEVYKEANIKTLINDINEFLDDLVLDGFVVSGENPLICNKELDINELKKRKNQGVEKLKEDKSQTTQDFFEKYFSGKPYPVSVHIEITNKCNERCIHCYIPDKFKCMQMSFRTFEDIVSQCHELNILHLTISGGEPLLHPDILKILSVCRKNNFSVNLLTNLTALTDDIIEEMEQNPLLGVQTSIYSMVSDVHDSITGRIGSFDKTITAVKQLIASKIPVQISCPIMKQNYATYKDVENWAKNHNILAGTDYTIIAEYNHDTKKLTTRLSKSEIKDIIKSKISTDHDYLSEEQREYAKNCQKTEEDYICSVCNSSICIGADGNIFPCAGWNSYVLGNIERCSLKDVWYKSEKVKQLRNFKIKDISSCKYCQNRSYCSICLVRNSNESKSGNPLEACKYFCDIAKIKHEIFDFEHQKNK